MLVQDRFEVPLPVDEAWRLLTDLEQVVPCMPGARLDEVVDGEYRGRMTSRIGPMTVQYAGTARFLERDEVDHRAVIALRGREERGSGSVHATVTTTLRPDHDRTSVELATELDVSGRAAQFGRGILDDVATSMLQQFATRLEGMVTGDKGGGPVTPATAPPAEGTLDVPRMVVASVVRRTAVPATCILVGALGGWLIARQRRPSTRQRRRLPRLAIVPAGYS